MELVRLSCQVDDTRFAPYWKEMSQKELQSTVNTDTGASTEFWYSGSDWNRNKIYTYLFLT